jgi:perosamine synthetase
MKTSDANIHWWRTEIGQKEIDRLVSSIKNEHISQGPVTREFEELLAEMLDIPYAVATTSGSMALLMALIALGIGPGDEVLVPNRTFIATAHAVLLAGAKVGLVDTKIKKPIISLTEIEKKITPMTRAIIPVHLNGRACDMDGINRIARKNGLIVIEDAAQALMSKNINNKYLGTLSKAGCFSFGMAKLFSTGQGGVVVTRDKDIYKKLKLLRTHGVSDTFDSTYDMFGFNFRFTDMQASIGIGQLNRAHEKVEKVLKIYDEYEKGIHSLDYIRMIPVDVKHGEIPNYVEALSEKRTRLIEYMKNCGIEVRPFLPNLNNSPHLNDTCNVSYSELFQNNGLFLPCGPDQRLSNIHKVLETLKDAVGIL